ncbi:hypothetical protein [Bradyrhizobium cosmicum]|uniref:hypothetical protein n=1 Tax=Bradyrhizobium cosmicum TaxID=1404864 RepID=UPI0028EDA1CF|nr:hypothetical protein [Bradyrhizobium cosmicum]
MSTAPIIELLIEVEFIVPTLGDDDLADWADKRCDEIRDALVAGDASAAAWAACQLGERLAEIRRLGEIARRLEREGDERGRWQRRKSERTNERRAVFEAERKRCFSDAEAYKRAAVKLGVTAKTIRRDVSNS